MLYPDIPSSSVIMPIVNPTIVVDIDRLTNPAPIAECPFRRSLFKNNTHADSQLASKVIPSYKIYDISKLAL